MNEFILALISLPTLPILIFLISFLFSSVKARIRLLILSLLIFSLCSLPIFHKLISYPLIYTPKYITKYKLEDVRIAVLLTGGLYKNEKGQWQPSDESKNRFLRARNLLMKYNFTLVISGGATKTEAPSEANLIKQFYKLDNVILDTVSLNTYQSAVNLKDYCINANTPLLIITNKYHALRSYLTFKSKDCEVFIHHYNKNNIILWDFIPSLYSYSYFNDIIREYLGILYYLITFKINFFD